MVLITGAARGMGKAKAELFADEGAITIATDINKKDIEKVTNTPSRPAPEPPQKKVAKENPIPIGESVHNDENKKAHASPSVRKFARNLGVHLSYLNGSGNKNRILIYQSHKCAAPLTPLEEPCFAFTIGVRK